MGFYDEEIHFLFFDCKGHLHEVKINFFTSESFATSASCLFIFKNLKTGTHFAIIYVKKATRKMSHMRHLYTIY